MTFSLLDMALAFIAGALFAAGFLWCALLLGLRAAERDEHAHHS